MEARVQRFEDDMRELKTDVKAIRIDLAYVKGRLDSMPTTVQLILFAVAVFAAAGLTHYFGR
jgi:hypothetical protein